MTNETAVPTPPYASFTSFQNFLDHLRDHPPLPPRIDKSVMGHLNYGTQQALLSCLRSLALIHGEDAPTDRLEKLVLAKDNQRAPIMLTTIKEGYPYFWNGTFDLTRATADQFTEKIRNEGKVGGSTVDKALSFFMAAATAAGLKLSPHLTKRKAGKAGRTAKAKTNGTPPPASAKRGRPKGTKNSLKPRRTDEDGETDLPMVNQLLDKFPDFDPKWDQKLQEKWFEGFTRLMNSAGLKEAKKP
jgi:hypothetical protein